MLPVCNSFKLFSVWDNIIDTENKHKFLCSCLSDAEKVELANAISFEKVRFNWINPSGRWRLDMGNKTQRDVMMKFIALNTIEATFSQKSSGRGDTSQKVIEVFFIKMHTSPRA